MATRKPTEIRIEVQYAGDRRPWVIGIQPDAPAFGLMRPSGDGPDALVAVDRDADSDALVGAVTRLIQRQQTG